jgi:hypothetical protein
MCKKLFCTLTVLGIILTSGANADIYEGLIGWWMFDEGTGTTVADSSGAGHDGFFVNSTPEWVPGMYGTALKFDGTDKVEIPDHPDFHFTNAMSVALWMQPAGVQASSAKLFIKQKSGQYPYSLQYDDTSQGLFATVYASTRYDTAPHIPDFPGEWAHVCFTYNGSVLILYKDGQEAARVNTSGQLQQNNLSLSIGCRLDYDQNFNGIIDDVRLFNRELSSEEVQQVMVDAPADVVTDPSPADGATDVLRDVVLSFKPIEAGTQHDIYLGTDMQAVAGADTSDTTGLYRGRQITDSYIPAETLEFGKTYYWRVDEIGAPPDNTVLKGNIWSFTAELFVYPITNIIATASSSEPGKEAVNTVNGSGLDDSGLLHSNESVGTMWLSSEGGEQPTWIEFEFDRVHKLYELWVWNSNDSLERMTGLGFREVKIEYSVDGIDYMTLGTTHQFTQAPGTPDYAHNTTIDMEGVAAKYIRLTAISNFKGIFEQFGLSEVRFFSIPVSAREPSPAPGATDVELDPTLGWSPGREATRHDVYFSDDLQAVIDGIEPAATVTESSYGPVSLDIGTTYYWRIDEVNDAETPAMWKGDIWDFTTVEYLTVDDFESYDAGQNQIWYAWKDGLGYGTPDTPPYYAGNGTGAAVGDELTESFTEETIVHSGKQSMPLSYNNNKQGYLNYSEATMTLSSQRDWTARGVAELSLWFRGCPASVGSFVEEPIGTYTMTASGEDIWNEADQFHCAFKQLTGVGSITARVESIENTNVWAKAGVMIRETLDADSKFVGVFITPVNGCSFQARTNTDTAAVSDSTVWTEEQQSVTAPYWVKLERDVTGSFKGYFSDDGVNWQTMIWKPNVSMGSNVYIGLALTSHDVALTCEAKFSGVQTTGTVTGQWQSRDIGIFSNSAEPMYVAIGNSTGEPAIVYHDNPAATQIGTWTEWIIPLKTFENQGINLAGVDNISIGIGDSNNPQPGGSGKMFFDDIRLYGSRSTK